MDHETFPKFILQLHIASCKLLTMSSSDDSPCKVTLNKLYNAHLVGSDELLKRVITVPSKLHLCKAFNFHMNPKEPWCPLDLEHLRLVSASNKPEFVKFSDGVYAILTPDRYPGADAVLPFAQEQYKYSTYLEQLQVLPASTKLTGTDANTEVKKFLVEDLPFIIVSPKPFVPGPTWKQPAFVGLVCGDDFYGFARGFALPMEIPDETLKNDARLQD